jgi:arylsulfatase A-like enzyme
MRRRLLGPALAGLALAACGDAGGREAPAPALPGVRPNLVVYLIDTLRADHLGSYGYPKPTSPEIDELARSAVRFVEARAQSSWTKPAVATILTGLYPVQHGAERRSKGLDPSLVTLAERLATAGYQTAFFGTNPTVTQKFGFDQGFDEFNYVARKVGRRRRSVDSHTIHREIVAWLDRRDASKPFFLFVHTLDPHDAYRPDEPWRSRFAPGVDVEAACCVRDQQVSGLTGEAALRRAEESRALYDGEIAQNDAAFGLLVDELERRGLADGSAIVLTSDHGEEFFDHGGWGHASTLYEEVLRVPFILRLPRGARGGTELAGPLDQIDVAPTLLALAGLDASGMPGASWLPALDGGDAPDAESLAWLAHPSFSISAAAGGGWKWIGFTSPVPPGRPAEELFRLAADPLERENLLAREPGRARWLAARSASVAERAGPAVAPEVEIDAELDRELRALGYI